MSAISTLPIAILGAGSWGTALALHLSRLGQIVHLWTIETSHAALLQKERVNQRYLPHYPFPDCLVPKIELTQTIDSVQDIIIAVPSVGFRSTLLLLKPLIQAAHSTINLCCATKGIDEQTGQLLHEVAAEIIGPDYPYAVISGPSFAQEVAAGLPTAVVIASDSSSFAHALANRFNSPFFRTYISHDVIGVEMGGAVKNVLAIATGISDGMGFGANARCALITRGLVEIQRLGTALGAQSETLIGLAGLGDLILTCTDNQSRNRRFGLAIGQGQSIQQAEQSIQQVIEGKRNAELINQLAKKHQIEMPICEIVLAILTNQLTLKEAMYSLLSRESKNE